ncbi:MAG: hypothetical protein V1754_06200 [Pseudomonadota bacterium]
MDYKTVHCFSPIYQAKLPKDRLKKSEMARNALLKHSSSQAPRTSPSVSGKGPGHLSNKARRILRILISVIIPRNDEINLALEQEMVDFVDSYIVHFPRILRFLFPFGLYLLEYGTWFFCFSWRKFSKLSPERRALYIDGWAKSRFLLKRELFKGIKGLALLAFYSQPRIAEILGYRCEEWIVFAKRRRLEQHGDDILKREAKNRGI